MHRRRDILPISPLVYTLWSCRNPVLLMHFESADDIYRLRKRSTDNSDQPNQQDAKSTDVYDNTSSNKRIRLNSSRSMNGRRSTVDYFVKVSRYTICHENHDDLNDIDLIHVLMEIIQQKRSLRSSFMCNSARGHRRLRRMVISLSQFVMDKCFVINLQNISSDIYSKALATRQKYQNTCVYAPLNRCILVTDIPTRNSVNSFQSCQDWFALGSSTNKDYSQSQAGNWGVSLDDNPNAFVSKEEICEESTNLMDISRNTISYDQSDRSTTMRLMDHCRSAFVSSGEYHCIKNDLSYADQNNDRLCWQTSDVSRDVVNEEGYCSCDDLLRDRNIWDNFSMERDNENAQGTLNFEFTYDDNPEKQTIDVTSTNKSSVLGSVDFKRIAGIA